MKTEHLPSIGLAIVTVAFLMAAYGYSPQARAFPILVGWATVALIAVDFVSRRSPGTENSTGPSRKQATAVLSLAAFAAGLVFVGVAGAVSVYMIASLRFQGRRSWPTSIGVSAVVTAALWLLFTGLLHLDLDPGYLFGGA